MQSDDYPGLATLELIVEVKRLLATERQTERLICRYLADLAERVRDGLDNALEAAFVSGELSYSRVRELTRVAEPSTETEWLELARTLDMRALERRVAAARGSASSQTSKTTQHASARTDKPVRTEWLTQNTVRVTFELSAETWGVLERALEGARRCDDTTGGAQ